MDYSQLSPQETIEKVINALNENGMEAELVSSGMQAKTKVLAMIPQKAEVMTMTSITLSQTGIEEELNTSEKYASVKQKLHKMNRETDSREMQKMGAAPEWAIGSVHAITENGHVLIASNTGSQLPAYVYGADHVIWVVSTKKIVKDMEEGMKRISKYILPKESARARKAYGLPEDWHSNISKILIVNKEVKPGRIHIIFVNEDVGF
jgi:L-lactate utilization protein LutC